MRTRRRCPSQPPRERARAHSSAELKQKDGVFSRGCLAARVFPAQEEEAAPRCVLFFFMTVTCLSTYPHDRDALK